jgi:Trk K+ transport system NAD-binding subunit
MSRITVTDLTESPCVGQSITAGCLRRKDEVEFILVLPRNRALWPQPDLKLAAGDRLVAITSDADWSSLNEHLDNVDTQIRKAAPDPARPAGV